MTTDTSRFANYPSLVDRTVFVSGGADGIGAALVRHFARQGSRVGFVDKNATKAAETIASCAGVAHTRASTRST